MTEKLVSIDEFIQNSESYIENINTNKSNIFVLKDNNIVMVATNIDQYNATKKALYMMKLMLQGENDIKNGDLFSHNSVFDELNQFIENN